ncbi:MAG: metallophosphoesterase family protein [Eubacteriales bacterium]|nr:metallophosphoesterase family protein [Eubacteriales bacterium]
MSTKVGIISDTHGLLRPQVLDILKTCDCILHAGDVTRPELLDKIRYLGNLYVVRGNNDRDWASNLSVSLRFTIEGVKFFMVHNKKDADWNLGDTQVVIFGHSHRYSEKIIDGRLWLNPGSCGIRRFGQELTMAVMTIDNGTWQTEKISVTDSARGGKETS